MAIQIAQPQVCYPNPKRDTPDLKSSMCRKASNAAKTILSVDITGKDPFESVGSLSTPAPPHHNLLSTSRVLHQNRLKKKLISITTKYKLTIWRLTLN